MSYELSTMIARDMHVLSIVFIVFTVMIGAVALWIEWKI